MGSSTSTFTGNAHAPDPTQAHHRSPRPLDRQTQETNLVIALAIGVPIALILPGIPVAASLGWQWLQFQLNDEICIGYLDGEPVAAKPGACE